ncbi:MAG: DUF4279 domain-containing protein [Streptosporangiales bacterium]|nr:DUF4279 domain-containing protein [Streptosporangiales bacterium]
MSAFRIYLRVVSSRLPPEEISDRLGTEPDSAYAVGSRRRPQARPRNHTSWMRHATAPGTPERPEDLEPVILGWGMDFASAVGDLVESGDATAMLEIVQEIRDLEDVQAKGIFLSEELITWLSTAQASIDIDQYILHDCAEDD